MRTQPFLDIDQDALSALVAGELSDPHRILGAHPLRIPAYKCAWVIRAFHPDAVRIECLLRPDRIVEMSRIETTGVFAIAVESESEHVAPSYKLRFHFVDGNVWERGDPYRYLPTVGETDLYLFNEGNHRRLWEKLGAHVRVVSNSSGDNDYGVSFAVWAPGAKRVSVVGDFCRWDGRLFPMRALGSSGLFEIFVPDVTPGALYKFEILDRNGNIVVKTDPMAQCYELPPATASRVYASSYQWNDHSWMAQRARTDPTRAPMVVYEVHLGSWARIPEEGNRILTYRELAPRLVAHAKALGFNYLELLPIAEHPFTGSWGYQVTGYFAPTSRYGTPDDFRFFVDYCHQNDVGVIVDWVPAHFPKDQFALRCFDGTALYEHADPRRGEHPDWGTLIFNFARNEVRSFLIANALYWLDVFHIDGLRVDAVASMLYLDYSREHDEWLPNAYGGKENLEAISFLQQLNDTIHATCPGCFTVAEESTSWPGVTTPTHEGGLGFTFKWNIGWMHDSLDYFSQDPVYRKYRQGQLTFAMVYEYSEKFIMPLSHDEVVHGKGSLLTKMSGDTWQKFANLRALYVYLYTRPGKKLLFMGNEFAPTREWNHDTSLDWHLTHHDSQHLMMLRFVAKLGAVYHESPCFWHDDHRSEGFGWIDNADQENSVLAFARWANGEHRIIVLNLTPVARRNYRIGVPRVATYSERLNSDHPSFGGSGFPTRTLVSSEPYGFHGHAQSIELDLPPLVALVLEPVVE